MKCPVCLTNRATGPHHIKPLQDGGGNGHKNKVFLCKRCHDIVEDITNRTGAEFSSDMVALIRLDYGFPTSPDVDKSIQQSELHYSTYRLRKNRSSRRRFRFIEEKTKISAGGIAIRCPFCSKWHYPNKRGFVICPVYEPEQPMSNLEIDEFFNNLRNKIVKWAK
jgi:hypothetical protein